MEYIPLRIGAMGPAVEQIQKTLESIGYSVGEIDGKFGLKTRNAVIMFQRKNELPVDGVVARNTWETMSRVSGYTWVIDDEMPQLENSTGEEIDGQLEHEEDAEASGTPEIHTEQVEQHTDEISETSGEEIPENPAEEASQIAEVSEGEAPLEPQADELSETSVEEISENPAESLQTEEIIAAVPISSLETMDELEAPQAELDSIAETDPEHQSDTPAQLEPHVNMNQEDMTIPVQTVPLYPWKVDPMEYEIPETESTEAISQSEPSTPETRLDDGGDNADTGAGETASLSPGDLGKEVLAMQQRLQELGHYPGVLDGVFGDETVDAVQNFQLANSLEIDEIATPDMLQLLERQVGLSIDIPAHTNIQ